MRTTIGTLDDEGGHHSESDVNRVGPVQGFRPLDLEAFHRSAYKRNQIGALGRQRFRPNFDVRSRLMGLEMPRIVSV